MEVWSVEGLLWRCKQAGIAPGALLKRAGVNPNTLYGWRRGSTPHTRTMRKIMDAMAEALREMGIAEGVEGGGREVEVWSFAELLRQCEEAGIAPLALLKRAGVGRRSFFLWKRGRVPKLRTMKKLMDAMAEVRREMRIPEATRPQWEDMEPWSVEELLRRCRDTGIAPVAVLKRAGVNPRNLAYWRRGRKPTSGTMKKVMLAFREEARQVRTPIEIWDVEELMRRCEEAGVRPRMLLKRAGVEPNSVYLWENGTLPSVEAMKKVMDAFPQEAARVRRAREAEGAWDFGTLLRRCDDAGISLVTLLERAGVNPGNRYYWMRGGRPDERTREKILKALSDRERAVSAPVTPRAISSLRGGVPTPAGADRYAVPTRAFAKDTADDTRPQP